MTFLSFKFVLLSCLEQALFSTREATSVSFIDTLHSPKTQLYSVCKDSLTKNINWRKIPLHKKRNETSVLYTSALPQCLIKDRTISKREASLSEVSRVLREQLSQVNFNPSSCASNLLSRESLLRPKLWNEFEIQTQRSGWLAFQLSDTGKALWLQYTQRAPQQPLAGDSLCQNRMTSRHSNHGHLKQLEKADLDHIKNDRDRVEICPPPHRRKQNLSSQSSLPVLKDGALENRALQERMLWQLQYAHARCCSLLQLWRECVVPQTAPSAPVTEAASGLDRELDGSASPWLTTNRQLRLQTPGATSLLHASISTTDDLFWIPYRWPNQQYFLLLKRGVELYQAFEQFYRADLSGFSRQLTVSQDAEALLSASNFGLVTTTKNILKVLLEDYLNALAPTEL